MKKEKRKQKPRYYYVSGLAMKEGAEYNVGRTIKFEDKEIVTFDTVLKKFKESLQSGGFDYRFIWGWSLNDLNS